jgi:hypothetical protein
MGGVPEIYLTLRGIFGRNPFNHMGEEAGDQDETS